MNALKRNIYIPVKAQNVQRCDQSLELIKPNCEKSDWSEGYNKKAQG